MSTTVFHTAHADFDFHEQVVIASDRASGLQAIIAVHDTTLGPALGGCRMWPYASMNDAMTDVLRLSRGMSYKAAIAGLPLGGGKSVIVGNSHAQKTPELFRALGVAINRLAGRYITAEDVGTSPQDMNFVREGTQHVAGIPPEQGGRGDPSPMTALGTFVGIRGAVKHALGQDSVRGLTVAVQGLGHVGWDLCEQLHAAGAKLVVSDMVESRLNRARAELGAEVVSLDAIYSVQADVFAPCALGAVVNEKTLPQMRFKIIAGASNNVLATDAMGDALHAKGVLYAPDYVINGGGLIKVCSEYFNTDAAKLDADVRRIESTLLALFAQAKSSGEATYKVADRMAREIIARGTKP